MMFTHFFKFYNSCKGASSHSKQEEQLQNRATARNFLTINTQAPHNEQISKQERIIRPQHGRSMVEMLGVLAIVGVLSVGGIAGYSKAMMKYKLNKHAEKFNMLLNDALRYSHELVQKEGYNLTHYSEFFHKLGVIPDGFKYVNNEVIRDNFGNRFSIYAAGLGHGYKGGIAIYLNNTPKEVCYSFVQTAKENSANLYMIESQKTDTSDGSHPYQGIIWGDNYCNSKNKCLKNLKVEDFEPLCDIDAVNWLYILW